MDPITIGVALVFVVGSSVVSAAVGAGAGVLFERQKSAGLRARVNELRQQADRVPGLEHSHAYTENTAKAWREKAEAAAKDRDRFRQIAESHEVKYLKPPEAETETVTVWSERLFVNRPSVNLEHIEEEMRDFLDEEVVITIKINPAYTADTGFAKALTTQDQYGRRTPHQPKEIEFHGPGRRALSDITTYLRDDDSGFVAKPKKKGKGTKDDPLFLSVEPPEDPEWVDSDSPLPMKVTLKHVKTVTPEKPVVHTVEVAVVQTEVKIIEVEKPMTGPGDITALVDETVARRLADLEVEQVAQVVKAATRRATRVPEGGG